MQRIQTLVLPLALVAMFAATDVAAQKKDKEHDDREKVERRDDRPELELRRRSEDRLEDGRRRGVPPGWCKGRGNPHNTVENCGRRGERYDRRYEDRDDDRVSGSYEEAHDAYHRNEYARCRARLAERPLDVAWQLRVRAECKRQHDEWHRRAGRSHG